MDLKLNRKVATVAGDTTAIITKKNGAADLLFLQFTQEGISPEADVIASVRFTSIEELENLKKTIEESIEKHRTAEV